MDSLSSFQNGIYFEAPTYANQIDFSASSFNSMTVNTGDKREHEMIEMSELVASDCHEHIYEEIPSPSESPLHCGDNVQQIIFKATKIRSAGLQQTCYLVSDCF